MSTYRQLTYLVLDELKMDTDDTMFNENHVSFLLNKYRAFILKQYYNTLKKETSDSNYQTICLDLNFSVEDACADNFYLKSTEKVPFLLGIGITKIYPVNFYTGEITYITRERMKYVGNNKYLRNIIYASLNPEGYLILRSKNPQVKYLKKIKMTAIFEDDIKAYELQCDDNKACDILDREFPLEENFINTLVAYVVKEIRTTLYIKEDELNNANDDVKAFNTGGGGVDPTLVSPQEQQQQQ